MYKIVKSECLADKIYLMDVEAPRIARACQPGEFVIVKMDEVGERIPLTICDYDREKGLVTIVFQIVGASTERMAGLKAGDSFADFVGPLGQPSEFVKDDLEEVKKRRYLFVAGGVGSAPLYPLAEELTAAGIATDAILGASTIDALVARERYGAVLGCEPACSTDDGTYGRAGFCTPLVEEALAAAAAEGAPYDYVACCGPEPLMKIVAGMADAAGVFCEVSMERRMACGVGACLSCVVDTTAGKRRACVDGPVFCASEVVW